MEQCGFPTKKADMIADLLIAVVALLHAYFLVLEMFLWDRPFGRKTFGLKPDFATASKALAANQGLYNGFLAAGLAYGLLQGGEAGMQFKVFFLVCVVVAGIYGAATVNRKIFFVQAVPALAALAALYGGA
jgi:putative membrane protein